jgi:hypothetical protein
LFSGYDDKVIEEVRKSLHHVLMNDATALVKAKQSLDGLFATKGGIIIEFNLS